MNKNKNIKIVIDILFLIIVIVFGMFVFDIVKSITNELNYDETKSAIVITLVLIVYAIVFGAIWAKTSLLINKRLGERK